MPLSNLGWNPFFSRSFEDLDVAGAKPARVFRQDKHRVLVHDGADLRTARATGLLTQELARDHDAIVVGDWVLILEDTLSGQPIIRATLPRKSSFVRNSAGGTTRRQVVAANVDILFLVSGLDGDFNLRRIERYVTQAWGSGALPVVLLNKADLCSDVDGRSLAASAVAPGVDVHAISARDGSGLRAITGYLRPGTTVALVGSSGVGKSTLLNQLAGEDLMPVHAVREDDSRGRHTTTHREMIALPGGGLLIDTPGMRELQLWSSEEDVRRTFADVADLALGCRFNDCTHTSEPGCAVLRALETGELDEARYRSHQKLEREVAYLERRKDESAAYAQREHDRKRTRLYRKTMREKRDRRR